MQKALLGVLIAIALAVGLVQLIPGARTESVFDFDEVSGAARVLSDDVLSLDQDPKSDLGNYAFHGHFVLTAYEWTGAPCANGAFPTVGYTVACNSLPLGTRVYVDGIGERVVEDRGASWHSSNWMDIYLGDVSSCNAFGVREADVYVLRG